MGRMHSPGKGSSRRSLPFKKTPPSWLQMSAKDLCDLIISLAKKDMKPSQIGVLLRDNYGIP